MSSRERTSWEERKASFFETGRQMTFAMNDP